jgi:hypothetical protein
MHYYEIWFYYYGENDPRTDFNKEFTFYIKTEQVFTSDQNVLDYLSANFSHSEQFNVDQINCVNPEHYPHLSKWFEISASEFTDGCGIQA